MTSKTPIITVSLISLLMLTAVVLYPSESLSGDETAVKADQSVKGAKDVKAEQPSLQTGPERAMKQEPAKDEKAGEVRKEKSPYADAEISIRIIPSAKKTFGYDILIHGRPLVHQPSIPGLPGNEGFKSKQRARTVAEFVVKKIRNNEMPPTVTIEDLNRMDVLK